MSQEQLALAADMDRSYISEIELARFSVSVDISDCCIGGITARRRPRYMMMVWLKRQTAQINRLNRTLAQSAANGRNEPLLIHTVL